jgi:hypothetical protein
MLEAVGNIDTSLLVKLTSLSMIAAVVLACLHVALSYLKQLDESDGVVNWTGVSHALTIVKMLMQATFALAGLWHTKSGVQPVLVVLFEKVRSQFGETHPDDMKADK